MKANLASESSRNLDSGPEVGTSNQNKHGQNGPWVVLWTLVDVIEYHLLSQCTMRQSSHMEIIHYVQHDTYYQGPIGNIQFWKDFYTTFKIKCKAHHDTAIFLIKNTVSVPCQPFLLIDRQKSKFALVGRLFHYDVTIKWSVKQLRNCDITIEWRQKATWKATCHGFGERSIALYQSTENNVFTTKYINNEMKVHVPDDYITGKRVFDICN